MQTHSAISPLFAINILFNGFDSTVALSASEACLRTAEGETGRTLEKLGILRKREIEDMLVESREREQTLLLLHGGKAGSLCARVGFRFVGYRRQWLVRRTATGSAFCGEAKARGFEIVSARQLEERRRRCLSLCPSSPSATEQTTSRQDYLIFPRNSHATLDCPLSQPATHLS
jgi:hypothetical protein